MTNSSSEEKAKTTSSKYSPWRYLSGAIISGVFAVAFYYMTSAVVETFASKPITSTNPIVINISVAVRTLVEGMTALGMGIFGFVAVGLVAYTVQLLVQGWKARS